MTPSYVELSYTQVGLAASLVLVNGAVSVALGLGLGRRLLLASVRTVVQLLLVGLVLESVFALERIAPVLGLMALMAFVAGIAAVGRVDHRFPGIWTSAIVPIFASSWIVTVVALVAIVGVRPWWTPQYAIPLLGMVLGNTLTGISLGLTTLGERLLAQRTEVETLLSLGATRREAAADAVGDAVRTGMVPIVNAMMVVGIVSLPGMMTGQLLAGVAPIEAVKYQIVIMFLIAAGTALGTVGAVLLGSRWLFDASHRFLHSRIRVRR